MSIIRVMALLVAAAFTIVGIAIIAAAASSTAGLGPLELVLGLVPIGVAALLLRVR